MYPKATDIVFIDFRTRELPIRLWHQEVIWTEHPFHCESEHDWHVFGFLKHLNKRSHKDRDQILYRRDGLYASQCGDLVGNSSL